MTYTPSIDGFSDGYFLFSDARAVPFSGDYAVIAHDTFDYLTRFAPEPLLKVENQHYWPQPEHSVPPDVVGVPDDGRASSSEAPVLMARPDTCDDLILAGAVAPPDGSIQ